MSSKKNYWQEQSRKHRDDGERKKIVPLRPGNEKVVPMKIGNQKRQNNSKNWDQEDED